MAPHNVLHVSIFLALLAPSTVEITKRTSNTTSRTEDDRNMVVFCISGGAGGVQFNGVLALAFSRLQVVEAVR